MGAQRGLPRREGLPRRVLSAAAAFDDSPSFHTPVSAPHATQNTTRQVAPGDSALSLLPPWHVYQRAASLYLLSRGARVVYTNRLRLRDDLSSHAPDHFVCVPLVLELLHGRVSAFSMGGWTCAVVGRGRGAAQE